MRERILSLLALALLVFAPAVHGASCALDGGPAATLLLPYFEVDLDNANGRTTLFSVNNASDRAALAHVVLWTDAGVPSLTFDIYLTGYDVQTVNLRDIFLLGQLPRTADVARDPHDDISNRGDLSQDVTFPGCTSLPPPALPAAVLDHVRNAHTGRASSLFNGNCSGLNHGDRIARGYLTIDVVKSCTLLRPGDTGYFGPDGVATADNILWGDFFYVDKAGNFAQGENLVRLHAEPGLYGAGDATFYARFVNGSGIDAREPLPRVWAARYLNGGDFTGGTDLLVWRDVPWSRQPFSCGTFPSGAPLAQNQIIVFDEQERVGLPEPCYVTCPPQPIPVPFPAATTRIAADGPDFPTPFDFGWVSLDLGIPTGFEVEDPFAQAWVGQVSSAQNRFSVGLEGTALGGACEASRCFEGDVTEIGELCVLGPLQPGGAARFQVRPKGCFSTVCTAVFHAGCVVQQAGNLFNLDALFCLAEAENQPTCTPDCSGGGFADCSGGTLEAGSFVAKLGSLQLQFTVPSDIVRLCTGDPL